MNEKHDANDLDNIINDAGDTALSVAAGSGNVGQVRILLAAGANPSAHDNAALVEAVAFGQVEVVEVLLAAGAGLDESCSQHGPLLHAAVASYAVARRVSLIEMLVDAGADVEARNGNHYSALEYAASRGSAECVRALAEAGADVNGRADDGGGHAVRSHTPPLLLAACAPRNHTATMKVLVAAGAEVCAVGPGGRNALTHTACEWPRQEVVEFLLGAGVDPCARDAAGFNALERLCGRNTDRPVEPGDIAGCVRSLARVVDVNACSAATGNPPLVDAARSFTASAVQPLVAVGSCVSGRSETDRTMKRRELTPLFAAMLSGNAVAAHVLLLAGAAVDLAEVDFQYGSALGAVVQRGGLPSTPATRAAVGRVPPRPIRGIPEGHPHRAHILEYLAQEHAVVSAADWAAVDL